MSVRKQIVFHCRTRLCNNLLQSLLIRKLRGEQNLLNQFHCLIELCIQHLCTDDKMCHITAIFFLIGDRCTESNATGIQIDLVR